MSDDQPGDASGSGAEAEARAKQNHYQVLGIERGADERAIKKAYFGLIRKFPPDTHPEPFKDLRHAYEVLSDPVARKRFDDAARDYREYGDDAAVTLREAEALVQGATRRRPRGSSEPGGGAPRSAGRAREPGVVAVAHEGLRAGARRAPTRSSSRRRRRRATTCSVGSRCAGWKSPRRRRPRSGRPARSRPPTSASTSR